MDRSTILNAARIDVKTLPLTAREAFVLSQVDGRATLEDIAEIVGLDFAAARAIAERLVDLGAAHGPPKPRPSRAMKRPSRKSLPKMSRVAPDADACDLDDVTVAAILALDAKAAGPNLYERLGVARDADKKAIKRAYFGIASKYHPDRFFKKKLGKAKAPLERLFTRMTEAHDTLVDTVRRAAYDATLPKLTAPPRARSVAPSPRKSAVPSSLGARRSTKAPARTSKPPRTSKRPGKLPSKRPSVSAPEPFVDPAPVSERSLRRIYEAAQQIEAQRHVEMFLRAAEDALAAGDAIAAANHYRLALQNRDDPYIRAKLDDVDALARTKRHELNLGRAKDAERRERWADAAAFYARAHDAKPTAHLAERAAYCMRLAEGDAQRATELAEWATRADPNNAAGFVTLGELYAARRLEERAVEAVRQALELAPNDARAKALAKRLKGSRGGR